MRKKERNKRNNWETSFSLQLRLDEDTALLRFITKSKMVQLSSTPGSLRVDSDQYLRNF